MKDTNPHIQDLKQVRATEPAWGCPQEKHESQAHLWLFLSQEVLRFSNYTWSFEGGGWLWGEWLSTCETSGSDRRKQRKRTKQTSQGRVKEPFISSLICIWEDKPVIHISSMEPLKRVGFCLALSEENLMVVGEGGVQWGASDLPSCYGQELTSKVSLGFPWPRGGVHSVGCRA